MPAPPKGELFWVLPQGCTTAQSGLALSGIAEKFPTKPQSIQQCLRRPFGEAGTAQAVTEGVHAKEPLYKLYSGSCFMQFVYALLLLGGLFGLQCQNGIAAAQVDPPFPVEYPE